MVVNDATTSHWRLQELKTKSSTLQKELEAARQVEASAAKQVSLATEAEKKAELKAQEELGSSDDLSAAQSSAAAEHARARSKLFDVTTTVQRLRRHFRLLGGGDAGNGAETAADIEGSDQGEADGDDTEASAEYTHASEISASALSTVSDRDLNEVRKLPKPPSMVRRALELVHSMLAIADGSDCLPAVSDVDWPLHQKMLARDDFIKRVLALSPMLLSKQPHLLDQISERWPFLKDAVGTSAAAAATSAGGWKAVKAARSRQGSTVGRSVVQVSKENARPPAIPKDSSSKPVAGRTGRFAAAVAAVVEASSESLEAPRAQSPVTLEGVEFASRPCGAIFRFCAEVASAAMRLAAKRAAVKADLDAALRVLSGVTGEQAATEAYCKTLRDEEARRADERHRRDEAYRTATDARLDAKVAHAAALRALETVQKAADEAARLVAEAEAAAERRRLAEERRRTELAEKEATAKAAAQAEIEKDLASRAAAKPDVWLAAHSFSADAARSSVEFTTGSAVLPPVAAASLAGLARELRGSVDLRVHIAGHVAADEDPKLGSQRAMAVGGALIALGVLPLQLRAKGYGATVPLSRTDRSRLRVKSARRVTFHPLSEVCMQGGCEFPAGVRVPGDATDRLLGKVAALLGTTEHRSIRLCIEGHSDDVGDPAENAKLSLARATSVCDALEAHGLERSRLVPHGFGAAFPVDDNGSEAGRQRNRRVEFLVVPDVADALSSGGAPTASRGQNSTVVGGNGASGLRAGGRTEALCTHLSNRPGVS